MVISFFQTMEKFQEKNKHHSGYDQNALTSRNSLRKKPGWHPIDNISRQHQQVLRRIITEPCLLLRSEVKLLLTSSRPIHFLFYSNRLTIIHTTITFYFRGCLLCSSFCLAPFFLFLLIAHFLLNKTLKTEFVLCYDAHFVCQFVLN